jgi:hypothetical protein
VVRCGEVSRSFPRPREGQAPFVTIMPPSELDDMPRMEASGCTTTRRNFRDDAARALRAIFSSDDNWPNLSEAERDEWRGYFDRMLEQLHRLGYTIDHEQCSTHLRGSLPVERSSDDGSS